MSDIVDELNSALTVKTSNDELLTRARDEIVRLREWLNLIVNADLIPDGVEFTLTHWARCALAGRTVEDETE